MRILITGGFGLLAGRLAQFLSNGSHEIFLVSRSLQKKPEWLRHGRMIQLDWNDSSAILYLCKDIDLVIHAAGLNASNCSKSPVYALEFNGLTTTRLVEAAISQSVKRFIYLSTAHVYSDNLTGLISEKSCTENLHPYATSHLAGESGVLYAGRQKQLEGVVLRLSNAFGYPVKATTNCWMLAINNLCRQAVEKKILILNSGGTQHRDFISISEVCKVIEFLSTQSLNLSGKQVMNVASGVSKSILDIAHLIQQRSEVLLGYKPEIVRNIQDDVQAKDDKIYFQTEMLNIHGYTISTEITTEIDDLLIYCHRNFSRTQLSQ